jgi:NAD(P)H-hydrate epimerase
MVRLTRAQVREIDRLAVEKYHMPSIVLMENAARSAADVAITMLPPNGRALILCGGGNNGGDGLAVARHLHNRGVSLDIILVFQKDLTGDAAINLRIVQTMGLNVFSMYDYLKVTEMPHADLLIDAVFGTGLSRPATGDAAVALEAINNSRVPVLAIDLPSGMDCDTGRPLGPCIRATKTITFVAEKSGFANPESKHYTGDIIVGDIGCPRELIEEVLRPAR